MIFDLICNITLLIRALISQKDANDSFSMRWCQTTRCSAYELAVLSLSFIPSTFSLFTWKLLIPRGIQSPDARIRRLAHITCRVIRISLRNQAEGIFSSEEIAIFAGDVRVELPFPFLSTTERERERERERKREEREREGGKRRERGREMMVLCGTSVSAKAR